LSDFFVFLSLLDFNALQYGTMINCGIWNILSRKVVAI